MAVSKHQKLTLCLAATLLFHLSFYLYLDRVLFAPNADFKVSEVKDAAAITNGKAYYSRDRRYMGVVTSNTVEIFAMPGKKLIRTIRLGNQQVSYFKWLEDRDLAILALHQDSGNETRVTLTHVNPLKEGNELTHTINNLPVGSKISDVAYSTATNVIYMQIQTATDPDTYRVYRTDANHDIVRIPLTSNRIGKIATFWDQDVLVYDNWTEGTVIARFGDGSWRVISPAIGRYRLVGVDARNTMYIARLNQEGLCESIFQGRLQAGFEYHRTLRTPLDIRHIKMSEIQ
jgi:hypothetical protein